MIKCPDCGSDAPIVKCNGHSWVGGWICFCIRKRKAIKELERLRIVTDSGCWEWQGRIDKGGYGRKKIRKDGINYYNVHQVSFVVYNGDIPFGNEIDHKCRNRKCFNPDHLQAITKKENILLGIGPTAVNARKTHCNRGHPLSGDNLYVFKDGRRDCKLCQRIRGLRWWRANRSSTSSTRAVPLRS